MAPYPECTRLTHWGSIHTPTPTGRASLFGERFGSLLTARGNRSCLKLDVADCVSDDSRPGPRPGKGSAGSTNAGEVSDIGAPKLKGNTSWTLTGLYLDSCNCDWGCPCQFNARPTHGNCEGLGVVHVIRGRYGTVSLDRLNFAFAYAFPGAVHEGKGVGSFYVDRRSAEPQFEALGAIVTGAAGGGPFEVYGSMLDSRQAPRRAAITFVNRDIRSRARVGDWGRLVLEPIHNPVSGKVHRAVIELPGGFEAARMDQASTKEMSLNDGALSFRYESTYASFSKVSWSGP